MNSPAIKPWPVSLKLAFGLLLAAILFALLPGCATRHTDLKSEVETRQTNGVVTIERRTLTERATVFFDGKNAVDKYRAANSPKSQTVGIAGESQEATSTNFSSNLKSLADIIQSLPK